MVVPFLLVLRLSQEQAEMGATRHLDASSEIFTVLRNTYVFNFGGCMPSTVGIYTYINSHFSYFKSLTTLFILSALLMVSVHNSFEGIIFSIAV